jgi:hypothetical protein
VQKKIHTFIIGWLMLSPFMSIGQNNDIPIIAYWENGASYSFKVKKLKEKWEEDKITNTENTSYIANLKVLDSTETSYKLEWGFKKDDSSEGGSPVSLYDLFPNIIYTTDENGSFNEIENWKEISEILEGYYQSLMKNSKAEFTKEIQDNMNELFQGIHSKQGIEQIIMKELQILHFPYGHLFENGAPIEYQEELANFFGGDPISASGKISFQFLDEETDRCLIKQQLNIPTEETNKLMKGIMEKLKLNDNELEEAMKTWHYIFNDDNSFEMHLDTGVPIQFKSLRTINLKMKDQQVKRVDTIEITRIDQIPQG